MLSMGTLLLISFCLLWVAIPISGNNRRKPHVIIIVADDLGWNDVGFHGSDQIPTPNIDALAYSGVILQNYYVLPICTPSRSALMTAIHPIRTGMQHRVLFGNEPWGLPLTVKILPQYLKDHGYKTHAVGKWHLGHFKANYTPQMRGFDTHFGYWTGRQDYYDHTAQESVTYWGYDMRRGLEVAWDEYGHYSTDSFTREAVNIIQQHDVSNPMFLYLAHLAVHSGNAYQPLEAPPDIIDRFSYIDDVNRRTYAAMVWKLDESVGKVIEALSMKDMLKNSLIIFTTDNGGPAAGFNLNAASNWPLRGVKDTLWEGGVRGCALLWSPDIIRSRVINSMMHIQDWLPTIMTAVGSTMDSSTNIDGKDVWAVIQGYSNVSYDELLLNIDQIRNVSSLRKRNWKIVSGQTWDGKWNGWYGPSGRGMDYRYNVTLVKESLVAESLKRSRFSFPSDQTIQKLRSEAGVTCKKSTADVQMKSSCQPKEHPCLFDIMSDPCEQINLAEEKKDILNELLSALGNYKPVKPLNQPADPASNPLFWNYTWTHWKDYVS